MSYLPLLVVFYCSPRVAALACFVLTIILVAIDIFLLILRSFRSVIGTFLRSLLSILVFDCRISTLFILLFFWFFAVVPRLLSRSFSVGFWNAI